MADLLLSICIPTYNRASLLEATLESIVAQSCFRNSHEVEVVVVDNCSSDETSSVAARFVAAHDGKVRYFRNSTNILDDNFERALSHGRGKFLKLNNDTLCHREGSLERILETLELCAARRLVPFFSNGSCGHEGRLACKNLDALVRAISYFATWIGGFGIWKDDFDRLEDFGRCASLQLVQTDVLLRMMGPAREALVDDASIFTSAELLSKGGYNLYKVFVSSYLGLLRRHVDAGQLSRATVFHEKSKLMLKFVVPWTARIVTDRKKYWFAHDEAFSIVFREFKFHPVLYLALFYLPVRIAVRRIRLGFFQ